MRAMTSPSATDAASLIGDLEDLAPSVPGKRCQVGYALETLPPELRAAVEGVLDRADLAAVDLCQVLANHGFSIAPQTLRRHRRRSALTGCTCPAGGDA